MNFVKQTAHAQELEEELPVYRKRKIIIYIFEINFKKINSINHIKLKTFFFKFSLKC